MTKRERIAEYLQRGYSPGRIAELGIGSPSDICVTRIRLYGRMETRPRRRFPKRMTPRSVGLEQGVGTLSDAEPTQLTGQISGG